MDESRTVTEWEAGIANALAAGDVEAAVAILRGMAIQHPDRAADVYRVMQKAANGQAEVTMDL